MNKLCFCFMTYKDVEQTIVWENFFKDISSELFSCIVHRTDNITSTWLPNGYCILPIESSWGTWSLVEIELALYKQGLLDPSCTQFILLSGDSIPIATFSNVLKSVKNILIDLSSNNKEREKTVIFKELFEKWGWLKASQWKILERDTVNTIIKNENIIKKIFEKSVIPDEHALPIFLKSHDISFSDVPFIFIDWGNKSKICPIHLKHRPLPKTWHHYELTRSFINDLKEKNYLFIRKVCNSHLIDFDALEPSNTLSFIQPPPAHHLLSANL